MKKKYFVKLTKEEQKTLEQISRQPSFSKNLQKRACILLKANEKEGLNLSRKELAQQLSVSPITVYRILKAYHTGGLKRALNRSAKDPSLSTLSMPDVPQWDSDLFY